MEETERPDSQGVVLALSLSAAVMTCSAVTPSSLECYVCVIGFPRQESGVLRCLLLYNFTVVSAAVNYVFFPKPRASEPLFRFVHVLATFPKC